ncbi:AraC family transcriptional regulator ligand-binding domain-containing protein [Gordonia humi]|uniref:AraC family transcriptional regulator ligand-binding domain-containing protein n=1 Tax=Gordonia humi TaxID=686429 RepID=UPI003618F027
MWRQYFFGARIGRDYQPGRLGILDYLFLTSGNLDNALETVAKYNIVAADYGAYEYQKNSSDRRAAMIRTMPGEVDYTHAELFVVSWQLTMARHATGRDLRSARIELSQLASATHRDLLEALGVKSIEYGCPAATLSLSWDDLRLPLLGADPPCWRRCCSAMQTVDDPLRRGGRQRCARTWQQGWPIAT